MPQRELRRLRRSNPPSQSVGKRPFLGLLALAEARKIDDPPKRSGVFFSDGLGFMTPCPMMSESLSSRVSRAKQRGLAICPAAGTHDRSLADLRGAARHRTRDAQNRSSSENNAGARLFPARCSKIDARCPSLQTATFALLFRVADTDHQHCIRHNDNALQLIGVDRFA